MKHIKLFEAFKTTDKTSIIKRKIPITGFVHDHFAVPSWWLDQDRITLYDGPYWRSISTKNVEEVELLDTLDRDIVDAKLKEYRQKEKEDLKRMFPSLYKEKFPYD